MNENTEKKKGFFSSRLNRTMMIVLGALMLLTVVLNLLSRAGLTLTRPEWYLLLPAAVIVALIGWGFYGICRRIQKKSIRFVVAMLMVVVLMIGSMIAMSYGSLFINLAFPQKFATVRSEENSLVVMRILDPNEERIEIRKAARLKADPEGEPDIVPEDFGYIYTAYPPAMGGAFYRSNMPPEGEVYIGYASEGKLMVEWGDEGSARFYVENPAPGDGGEMIAHTK